MPGRHSTVIRRARSAHRPFRALLAAAIVAVAGIAALLVAVPGADAQTRPSAPTDLTVTGVRTNSVTLNWTASTPGPSAIAGYRISYARAYCDALYSASVGDVTTVDITSGIVASAQCTFAAASRSA